MIRKIDTYSMYFNGNVFKFPTAEIRNTASKEFEEANNKRDFGAIGEVLEKYGEYITP